MKWLSAFMVVIALTTGCAKKKNAANNVRPGSNIPPSASTGQAPTQTGNGTPEVSTGDSRVPGVPLTTTPASNGRSHVTPDVSQMPTKESELGGLWKSKCLTYNQDGMQSTQQFLLVYDKNGLMIQVYSYFKSQDCTIPSSSALFTDTLFKTVTYSYSLPEDAPEYNGMKPIDYTNQWGVPFEDIYLIEGQKLYFGNMEGTRWQDNGRPAEIDPFIWRR